MKLAFVSTGDPESVTSWSGTDYFMPRALQRAGLEVDVISSGAPPQPPLVWLRRAYSRVFANKDYLYERDPALARRHAAALERTLSSGDHDVVFAVGGHPIAYLGGDVPAVYWGDATFHAMLDFYPDFSNVSPRSRRDGDAMEAAALSRAALALFASDWAAESAMRDYAVDPSKVHVVPFGANLEETPSDEDVAASIASRSHEVCRLLFVGVDWQRKRGALAVDVARILNERGMRTELTVVGCEPSLDAAALEFTRLRGALDKTNPEESAELARLFGSSHFLLLPSRAECYGLVLCEANAYGVPVLASRVGGIPTIVREGLNGHLLDVDADARAWADRVVASLENGTSYERLARAAHAEFRARLNWDTSAATVLSLLERL